MLVSVIVCTYNRCLSLKKTIESLLAQKTDSNFSYEIVVIDNNSTDCTKEVVNSFTIKYGGRIRLESEKMQGVCFARNKGIILAKGELLVFTDDDCTMQEHWLSEMVRTFNSYPADAVLGKIRLMLPSSSTKFFSDDFLRKRLAHVDYGDEVVELFDNDLVGANMAFRRKVFSCFDGFNHSYKYCEDTELSRRLIKGGVRVFYSPSAEVLHWIPKERISEKSFLKQSFEWGKVQVTFDLECSSIGKSFYWESKKLLLNLIKFVFIFDKFSRFLVLCSIYSSVGYLSKLIEIKNRRGM